MRVEIGLVKELGLESMREDAQANVQKPKQPERVAERVGANAHAWKLLERAVVTVQGSKCQHLHQFLIGAEWWDRFA